jgi:hypothetical protein
MRLETPVPWRFLVETIPQTAILADVEESYDRYLDPEQRADLLEKEGLINLLRASYLPYGGEVFTERKYEAIFRISAGLRAHLQRMYPILCKEVYGFDRYALVPKGTCDYRIRSHYSWDGTFPTDRERDALGPEGWRKFRRTGLGSIRCRTHTPAGGPSLPTLGEYTGGEWGLETP